MLPRLPSSLSSFCSSSSCAASSAFAFSSSIMLSWTYLSLRFAFKFAENILYPHQSCCPEHLSLGFSFKFAILYNREKNTQFGLSVDHVVLHISLLDFLLSLQSYLIQRENTLSARQSCYPEQWTMWTSISYFLFLVTVFKFAILADQKTHNLVSLSIMLSWRFYSAFSFCIAFWCFLIRFHLFERLLLMVLPTFWVYF